MILTPDTFYTLRILIFFVTGLNLKQTLNILLCIFRGRLFCLRILWPEDCVIHTAASDMQQPAMYIEIISNKTV